MDSQTFRIIIEPDGKGFHGYVPALRGCHTWGKTIAQTKKHLKEAMALYVETLLSHGDPVPTDNSFESFETVATKQPPRKIRTHAHVRTRQYA